MKHTHMYGSPEHIAYLEENRDEHIFDERYTLIRNLLELSEQNRDTEFVVKSFDPTSEPLSRVTKVTKLISLSNGDVFVSVPPSDEFDGGAAHDALGTPDRREIRVGEVVLVWERKLQDVTFNLH